MTIQEIARKIMKNDNLWKWYMNWLNANQGEGGITLFVKENRYKLEEKIHQT